jgi:hypothetical protein
MPNEFTHDVFLSHSLKDKAVMCAVAERLRKECRFIPLRLDDAPIAGYPTELGFVVSLLARGSFPS